MYQIGLFQLLPPADRGDDDEVIRRALWEVDFAEEHGFESVWLAEHHFGGLGLVGAPSVYAAAIAQRTRRICIGYGVAVVPLHQPLRLAEEISWVDHLSGGRVMVGFGAGFDAREFAGFGVPLDQRHERLKEGMEIVRRALRGGGVRPRPLTRPHPPFYRASSSDESLREAAADGSRILFGTKPVAELRERIEFYRTIRARMGAGGGAIESEIAEMYVLRKIVPGCEEEIAGLGEIGIRKIIGWFDDLGEGYRFLSTSLCESALVRSRP